MKRIATVLAGLALAPHAWAQTSSLYGWTYDHGSVDFVSISQTDGHASFLFSIPLPSGYEARDLTWDPRDGGRFWGQLRGGSDSLLAEIDPDTMTMTTHAYSGLPNPGLEGIEYLDGEGLVVSGADVTGVTNALFVVDHDGVVQKTMLVPAIQDQDSLCANSRGGNLHISDVNHPTNGYYINEWSDPFGTPVLTGVYSGYVSGRELDVAIDPMSNTLYTSSLSALYRYDMALQQQVLVGDFNYTGIWGIAAVPAPGPIAIVGLGCGMFFRRRRTSGASLGVRA